MTHHIADVDADGAIQQQLSEAEGLTRGSFITRAGGAALTSGAFMAMLPELAAAKPSAKQDISILNYALTLEYLEAAFYAEAVNGGALSGAVLETARLLAAHEATHVTVLKKTIKTFGGKPVPKPKFDFKGTTGDPTTFLATSFTLENTGVHAYLGQVQRILSKKLLQSAANIVTIEARHAAAIAGLIGDKPYDLDGGGSNYTPDGAFDVPFKKATVLKAVKKTGFIVS